MQQNCLFEFWEVRFKKKKENKEMNLKDYSNINTISITQLCNPMYEPTFTLREYANPFQYPSDTAALARSVRDGKIYILEALTLNHEVRKSILLKVQPLCEYIFKAMSPSHPINAGTTLEG